MGLCVFLQEEKEKVRAQKEEVLNQMNDVLENELQCIICSEYFIEVIMTSGASLVSLLAQKSPWAMHAASAVHRPNEEISFLLRTYSCLVSK